MVGDWMAVIHCDSSSVERLRISCPIALANTVRCFHDWQQLHQYSHGFIVDSDTSTSFEIYRSKKANRFISRVGEDGSRLAPESSWQLGGGRRLHGMRRAGQCIRRNKRNQPPFSVSEKTKKWPQIQGSSSSHRWICSYPGN